MARKFVLLRVTRMREVNLALFDFDYDLTWMGFFLNAEEKVLGRYGGRDADSAEGQVSLTGLRYAMREALQRHRRDPSAKPKVPVKKRTVADFKSAGRLSPKACVHCHQVYDLRREAMQSEGTWTLDEVWVYPRPANLGLTLDVDQGDRAKRVEADSEVARAGLRPDDVLETVGGRPVGSIADVQYALHRAPARGELSVVWRRGDRTHSATLKLTEGWRKTDVSWRWSLRGLDPQPCVRGTDLDAAEKKKLGLSEKDLALRQGPFVHPAARQAGVRQNDVIIGADGKQLEMNARQFLAYVRLHYRVGDTITLNVLRDGKPLRVLLKLPGR